MQKKLAYTKERGTMVLVIKTYSKRNFPHPFKPEIKIMRNAIEILKAKQAKTSTNSTTPLSVRNGKNDLIIEGEKAWKELLKTDKVQAYDKGHKRSFSEMFTVIDKGVVGLYAFAKIGQVVSVSNFEAKPLANSIANKSFKVVQKWAK